MKASIFLQIVLTSLFFVTPNMANAELFDRGNGLIYDSDQNLTWLQDANYAQTSGHDADGKMTWYAAMAWAESLEYRGYDDWRLPTTTQHDDPTCPIDIRVENGLFYDTLPGCLGGEMERLTASSDPFNNPLFENVNDSRYWTATPYRDGIDPCVEGDFCFAENDNGIRKDFYWQWSFSAVYKTTLAAGNPRYAWAVRDGDVEDVPSPLNFVPITPCRLFDTRASVPPVEGRFAGGGETRDFFIYGGGALIANQGGSAACNIPSTALAVHLNFSMVAPSGTGFLRAWSQGGSEPQATLISWAGTGISNAAAIALNNGGDKGLTIKVYGSSTDLVGDVVGYYIPNL